MTVFHSSDTPLVAVVTPVYNGGKYLRRTMECVQAQTYPNIVHIVLDNASTDDSAAIIAEFQASRVPVMSFGNDSTLPLSANWNKAFSYVPNDATYAKLLCADDLIRFDAIEKFVDAARADPEIELVLSEEVLGDVVRSAGLEPGRSVFDGREVVRGILLGEVGSVAYHHFFVRIRPEFRNGNFIEDYWSPDPHVVLRSALRGKVAYLHEPLVYSRYHDDSVTSREIRSKGIRFVLVQMQLLQRFGKAAFADDPLGRQRYDRSIGLFFGYCCFEIMTSLRHANLRRARELAIALRESGFDVKTAYFVRYLPLWLVNKVKSRRSRGALGATVDEAMFMSMGHRPPRPCQLKDARAGGGRVLKRRAARSAPRLRASSGPRSSR